MIRLNLLQDRFGAASSRDAADLDALGGLTTTSLDVVSSGKGRRLALVAGVIFAAGVLGGGAWYLLRPDPDTALVPETVTVEKPRAAKADSAKARTASSMKDSLRRDSAMVKANAPATEAKPAAKAEPAPKVEPAPKPAPKVEPKPEPKKAEAPPPPPPETISIQPAVVAPALAGGVVELVLGESKSASASASASTPSRFEDLSPTARLAYQRFAFERILSVVRQVAGPDIRFSNVKILSPGIVTVSGTSKEPAGIASLVQGLLAQSLVDTALVQNGKGQFALMARLPFSASFGASATGTDDFKKAVLQARDLAASQGLELAAPGAPSVRDVAGLSRARWTLSGTGAWESVAKWIGALQSTQSPVGFTSLQLSAGPDGKLRVTADAISYRK